MVLNLPAMESSNHNSSSEEAMVIEVAMETALNDPTPTPMEARVVATTMEVVMAEADTTTHQHLHKAQRLLQLQALPVKMPVLIMLLNMRHTTVQVLTPMRLMVDTKPTWSTISNTWLQLRLSKLQHLQAQALHHLLQARTLLLHLRPQTDLQAQALTMPFHHHRECDWHCSL